MSVKPQVSVDWFGNLLHHSQSSRRAPLSPRSPLAAPTVRRRRSAAQRPPPSWSRSRALGLQERSPQCRTSWKSPWWKRRSTRAPSPWWWTPPATATLWPRRWTSRPCRERWTPDSSSAAPGCPCTTPTQRADSSAVSRGWRHRAAKTTWRSSRWDDRSSSWSDSFNPSPLIDPHLWHTGHPSVRNPARLQPVQRCGGAQRLPGDHQLHQPAAGGRQPHGAGSGQQ